MFSLSLNRVLKPFATICFPANNRRGEIGWNPTSMSTISNLPIPMFTWFWFYITELGKYLIFALKELRRVKICWSVFAPLSKSSLTPQFHCHPFCTSFLFDLIIKWSVFYTRVSLILSLQFKMLQCYFLFQFSESVFPCCRISPPEYWWWSFLPTGRFCPSQGQQHDCHASSPPSPPSASAAISSSSSPSPLTFCVGHVRLSGARN